MSKTEMDLIEAKVNEIEESLEEAMANKDFFLGVLYDVPLSELRDLSEKLKRWNEAAKREKREEEHLRLQEEEEFWNEYGKGDQ